MPTTKYPQLHDEAWLREHYVNRMMSAGGVAELIGCNRTAVDYSLKKYGIPRRGRHYGKWKPKTCPRETCGKEFIPSGPAQVYCSAACRAGTKVCERDGCDVTFALTPPKVVKGTAYPRRFCSKLCRNLWFRATARDRFAPNAEGYVRIVLEDGTRVLEHRHVMERKLGRPLEATETVHHIDGDRANNHPDNLQLRQGRHGKGARFVCRSCGSHDVVAADL